MNEAFALADILLHPAVEGEANFPPANPLAGECWLVGPAPTGAWSGQEAHIAAYQGGGWQFVTPRNGLCILDLSSGRTLRYRDSWQGGASVITPTGGTVIDVQARSAVADIISALATAGLIPAS